MTFHPVTVEAENGKWRYEGAGLVNEKGEYKAGFNGDGKGLVPGEYIVTTGIRDLGELPGSNSKNIPKQYGDKSSSPLKITVEQKDNKINLILK